MYIKPIKACRVCKSKNLIPILSLGNQFVSNFIDSSESENQYIRVPLELVLCDVNSGGCGLLQLRHTTPPEILYKQYWYKSGISSIIRNDLSDIVRKVESLVDLKNEDIVVDIGCNDGTMLRSYKNKNLTLVGFEPASNLVTEASVNTSKIINNFFNYNDFKKCFGTKKAKVVTAISMFYDLEDPNKFIEDIVNTIDKNGIFVIQQNYLGSMIEQNAFDNICHEHLEYYSLFSLENLLKRHNLEVFDVELNDINGGSFRTYIKFRSNSLIKPFEGAENRLKELREGEKVIGLNDKKIYQEFASRVNNIKNKLYNFIKNENANGKKIYIYGASTRGNTTLQFCDIDHNLIVAAADKNPDKWGKKTIGTMIPIISLEQYRNEKPDYLLILPWHLLEEIKKQEKTFIDSGGKFIVPLPNFKIIEDI